MDGLLGKFQKVYSLSFDEKPMPKTVLFQGVNKFVRHEKGPNQYGPGLIELEVMSQAVGLAKVALEQAGESLAVAGLVASHLVHGVVDGIEAGGLGTLGKIGLAGGGAVLGLNAHLEVLLGGVGHDLAQELGELGGVLGLLIGGLLPVQAEAKRLRRSAPGNRRICWRQTVLCWKTAASI